MKMIIMLDQLCKRIQEVLPWDKLVCRDGNTQSKERIYVPIIKDVVSDWGVRSDTMREVNKPWTLET
jgi:hypothetical protein